MSSPTVDHAYHPAIIGLDLQRRAQVLARWRRHSRLVRTLRVLLPAMTVGLTVLIAAWAGIDTILLRLSAAHRTSNMAIRMVNPKFLGRDQGGRPFVLGAALAVRDAKTPQMIYLNKPAAVLGSIPSNRTEANANRGVYREDTKILILDDDVHLRNATNDFVTSHAVVNTSTNDVDGQAHIDGAGAFGRIASDAYSVRNNGAHVYFNGHVRAHIIQGGAGGDALKGPR
jgi:lipopolysaccharide export system protein LptC